MIIIHNCPFCDHEDVEIDEVSGASEFAVCCPECRAIGPIKDSIGEAISAWNVATIRKIVAKMAEEAA